MGIKTYDKKELDTNDFWILRDNPVTREGVFPYMGYQISPEVEANKIYKVFRPLSEIASPEALESLKVIPFVDEHDMLGGKDGYVKPEDKGIDGVTGNNPKVDGDVVTIDLKIFTERLKDLIENNKKELSLGYTCDYEPVNHPDYDFIQKNIRYNHIALVNEVRMGHDIRVMDKQITYDSLEQIKEYKMADKREIIREIMAIAAKPDTDFEGGAAEKEDTIAKKLEEAAYEPSEAGTSDEELVVKQDVDDPAKVEVEIKQDGEEVIPEEGEKILDEEAPKEDEQAKDEDEPKKDEEAKDGESLVEEIGGLLKDKIDDDLLQTILGKLSGTGDECEEEKKNVSMDSAIKYIARRDDLVKRVRQHIGDNANYKSMTIKEVVKYACDKLDIKPSLDSLNGYLKGRASVKRVASDSRFSAKSSRFINEYLKK